MDFKEYCKLAKVISLEVYDNMTHAIGFSRDKIRRGKYVAYRNSYITNDRPEETDAFNIAIENGLMAQNGFTDTAVRFEVTTKGLNFIAFRENCKIVEMD